MKILHTPKAEYTRDQDRMVVGIAQIAPVWLDRAATLVKVEAAIEQAVSEGCQLVTFGEALVPGYPFWIDRTDGARFNDPRQKHHYARYVDQGVILERGDLDGVTALAKNHKVAVYLSVMERVPDRGSHSLYCTLVYVDATGTIQSAHSKFCIPPMRNGLLGRRGMGMVCLFTSWGRSAWAD